MARRYRMIRLPADYAFSKWSARVVGLWVVWHYRHDGWGCLLLGALAFVAVLFGLRALIGGPRR